MPAARFRPVCLAILDGFGENPNPDHNAVAQAKTPTLDGLTSRYPHGLINASEGHVGLPGGQMGNSEVGHMNIGSGRVVIQDLPRIDQALSDGSLAENPELKRFIGALMQSGGTCHLLGLLSDGGVHSHQRHMAALVNLLEKAGIPVAVHAFLDGRDTPPQSAPSYVAQFRNDAPNARFASVCGRYFAMDRDKRFERVILAHHAIEAGLGKRYDSIEAAISASYEAGKTDEFLIPAVIGDYAGVKPEDGLLMANFRADRARELLETLVLPVGQFDAFTRERAPRWAATLGMMGYSQELNPFLPALFPKESLTHILAEEIAARGMTQLHIAETEKYAHVTFFFNGGREEPFPGEDRILVPSPKVATYDLKPEMSAVEVTDRLVAAIEAGTYDFIVVNYANTDMVGHTGKLGAAIIAVETVDACLARVFRALEARNGALIVTADHGNAEKMEDEHTHQPHTAHTLNVVPFILAGLGLEGKRFEARVGKLADIAPTVLSLMGIVPPAEMTGTPFLPV